MLVESYGQETWETVAKAAKVSESDLVSLQTYEDNIALRLVSATSQVLDTPVDQCLELFGYYWLKRFAPQSFSGVLDATGADFVKFIGNLNRLHDRITSTFPSYRPPEFFIEDLGEDHYMIDYISTREGFAPFVKGIFKAIAERFNITLVIKGQTREEAPSGEHWRFEIETGRIES